MYMGLTKEQIIDILSESGIRKGVALTAESLVEAIATVIVENNDCLSQSTTNKVIDDFSKQLSNL